MIKLFTLWNRRLDLTHDEAIRQWTQDHVPVVKEAFGPACTQYMVNVGLPADFANAFSNAGPWPDMAPPYDGVAEAWLDVDTADEALALLDEHADEICPSERRFVGTMQQMVCEELEMKNLHRPHTGIKFTWFLQRRADMTPEQSVDYWSNRHAPLVLENFGDLITRYAVNVGLPGNYTGWSPEQLPPYDGIAEFCVDVSLDEMKAAIEPKADIVLPDEQAFLGTYRGMVVEERIV